MEFFFLHTNNDHIKDGRELAQKINFKGIRQMDIYFALF